MSSRLVVIPSRFETLCIVALEALSYGKKVITFDIDGFRWLPKSLISKVKPFDVEELVKSIDKNIEKEISNTHFLKAREFTKSYSWEQITKEYDRYLQRLA